MSINVNIFPPITLEEMKSVKLMNRIDTKYVLPIAALPAVLSAAVAADYRIQETAGQRLLRYDTLYYDTADLDMFTRHHNRCLTRQKIRIREYCATGEFFLEVKRKSNTGRTKKKRMAVSPVVETSALSRLIISLKDVQHFIAEKSVYQVEALLPQLRTMFERITLVNSAKTERLTIDLNLTWENIQTAQTATIPNLVIIELKRDGRTVSQMQRVLRDQGIRPLKMSKYCIGTTLTNPSAKSNRFKEKIRRINKRITHQNF